VWNRKSAMEGGMKTQRPLTPIWISPALFEVTFTLCEGFTRGGAYRIRSETGLLIPSVYNNNHFQLAVILAQSEALQVQKQGVHLARRISC
jgi:hypothetical protein